LAYLEKIHGRSKSLTPVASGVETLLDGYHINRFAVPLRYADNAIVRLQLFAFFGRTVRNQRLNLAITVFGLEQSSDSEKGQLHVDVEGMKDHPIFKGTIAHGTIKIWYCQCSKSIIVYVVHRSDILIKRFTQ